MTAPDEDPLFAGYAEPEPLQVVDATELLSRLFEEPRYVVRHLVPEAAIVLLSGDTGSAKTALGLHAAVAVATGQMVAGRFTVAPDCGPVLYLNGEMSSVLVTRYLREAMAGLDCEIAPGRLHFEGIDGVATFRFLDATHQLLEDLVAELRPSLVIIDTQRALLIDDENDGVEVRHAFAWLRARIVNAFGASVLVCHHLRKLSATSNSERERVSGSRDILASVDVHLAAISRGEMPMHALRIGKTRYPVDGVAAGTEWPIEARLEYGAPGEPNRSIFVAGEIADQSVATAVALDAAKDELRALFAAGEPLTRKDAQAKAGNRKRAWDALRDESAIVKVGNRRQEQLYTLAELTYERGQRAGNPDHAPDHGSRKPPSRKGLRVVKARPRSDHAGSSGATLDAPSSGAATQEPTERGRGQSIYRDHDHDHASDDGGPCAYPIGPAGGICSRCGLETAAHYVGGEG